MENNEKSVGRLAAEWFAKLLNKSKHSTPTTTKVRNLKYREMENKKKKEKE